MEGELSPGNDNSCLVASATGAGTGPGIAGGEEKSGRASSRKEKDGRADESTAPRPPGIAGIGESGTPAGWACAELPSAADGKPSNAVSDDINFPESIAKGLGVAGP